MAKRSALALEEAREVRDRVGHRVVLGVAQAQGRVQGVLVVVRERGQLRRALHPKVSLTPSHRIKSEHATSAIALARVSALMM
jgi:hypothetical protein